MRHPENPWWEDWVAIPADLLRALRQRRWNAKRKRRLQELGRALERARHAEDDFQAQVQGEVALEALLDLCQEDVLVQEVMIRHELERTDLSRLYTELVAAGCGVWVRGHYVAASVLAYGDLLEFYLTAPRHSWAAIEALARRLLALLGEVEPKGERLTGC